MSAKSPNLQSISAMHPSIGSLLQENSPKSSQPHPPKPFLKNRQFYKPEAFIWNNPHRASQKMYKFYHCYNDHFESHQQPLIRRQEQQDREDAETQRVHRLLAFRSSTRRLFAEQQKNREVLQERSMNGSSTAIRTETGMPLHVKYSSQKAIHGQVWGQKTGTLSHLPSHRQIQVGQCHRTSLGRLGAASPDIAKLMNESRQEWQLRIKPSLAAMHPQHTTNCPKTHPIKRLPFL